MKMPVFETKLTFFRQKAVKMDRKKQLWLPNLQIFKLIFLFWVAEGPSKITLNCHFELQCSGGKITSI
jgi:hypothetical protein